MKTSLKWWWWALEFLEADHLIQDWLDYCCGNKKVTLLNIRNLPPWGEQSTEHKTLSLCADVWNILCTLDLILNDARTCALNCNGWELSFYKANAFDLFSVMLELLTQRKAVEKTGALHHVLKKEGVLSDPERLMTKAGKVSWFFEVYNIDEKKSS